MNKIDDIFNYLVDTIKLISNSTFGNKMILKGGSVLISKLLVQSAEPSGRRCVSERPLCGAKRPPQIA